MVCFLCGVFCVTLKVVLFALLLPLIRSDGWRVELLKTNKPKKPKPQKKPLHNQYIWDTCLTIAALYFYSGFFSMSIVGCFQILNDYATKLFWNFSFKLLLCVFIQVKKLVVPSFLPSNTFSSSSSAGHKFYCKMGV